MSPALRLILDQLQNALKGLFLLLSNLQSQPPQDQEPVPPAAPQPTPAPVPASQPSTLPLLDQFAVAIQSYEGFFPPSATWPTGSPQVREMITGNNPHVRPTRRQRHHDDGKSLLVPPLLCGTMIPDLPTWSASSHLAPSSLRL